MKCGTDEHLEFDHVDPATKASDVSRTFSMTLETWLVEIDKCQLLCKAHHVEKTRASDRRPHNRWRYLKHRCRCAACRLDYSTYRKSRYAKNGT